FISPDTDPKTLCPYCDCKLPEQLTPKLIRLLEKTFSRSYRDSRPANLLGRKAPTQVIAALCQLHNFESSSIPLAIANGWPTNIDWSNVEARVLGMRGDLEEIISDMGEKIVYGGIAPEVGQSMVENTETWGPRMHCIFWRDVLKDLKLMGSRRFSGITGQLATFDKIQPGYYGEQGTIIIHRTLYKMFPFSTNHANLVQPLSWCDFIGSVLLPEVGMRLIMEDMSLDVGSEEAKNIAVSVMRESTTYGVGMFAAGDNDSDEEEDQ
ncbi:RTC4-like domain-containing protein, partial [Mycena crocata]